MNFFQKLTCLLLALIVVSFTHVSYSQDLIMLSNELDSLSDIKSDRTIEVAKKLEKLTKKNKTSEHVSKAYASLAKAYYKKGNFNKSIKYFDKELLSLEKTADKVQQSESYYNLGSTCLKLKKNTKAKNYFEKSLTLAQEANESSLIYSNYNALVIANENLINYKKSTYYLKKLIETDKGLFDSQINLYKKQVVKQKKLVVKQKELVQKKSKQLDKTKKTLDTAHSELKASAETIDLLEEDTLRKQQKISSLNFQKLLKDYEIEAKNEELKAEKKFTLFLIIGLSCISVLAIFVFILLQSKKRMNLRLELQKQKITSQNEAITDSIHYASKIQQAALPNEHLFDDLFKEYFVFFEPRDIVSGDFYFVQKINNHIVFAAVDCTGHGVPGAFMSMLGIAFLNDIIRKKEVTQANQILNILRDEIKLSLQQSSDRDGQKDGMDMAVCVINTENNELQYSGAHNPLILVRDNELIEFKADRMPVGIHRRENSFANHVSQLQKDDQLYIFSDGFADQIGEETRKKYKSRPFKNHLLKNSKLPMATQKDMLVSEFHQWKGSLKQIDDIVIIGVKI